MFVPFKDSEPLFGLWEEWWCHPPEIGGEKWSGRGAKVRMGPVPKQIPGPGKTQHRSCCFCVVPAQKPGEKCWKMDWPGSGSCLRGAFRSPESCLSCWRGVCALSCQPCSRNLSPFASQQEIPTFHLNGSSPHEATFLLLFGIGAIPCLGAPLSHWEKHFEWLLGGFGSLMSTDIF